jgi:hypothetical protein
VALLSKEQILGADDRRYEDVSVPEWDGEVRVRSLSGLERDRWEASMLRQVGNTQKTDYANARAKLVAASAVDEAGNLMFPDAKDVVALGKKSSAALDRVFAVCKRLSGVSDEDIEDLEGNSEPAQSGPSTSVSPPTSVSPSPNSWPVPTPAS